MSTKDKKDKSVEFMKACFYKAQVDSMYLSVVHELDDPGVEDIRKVLENRKNSEILFTKIQTAVEGFAAEMGLFPPGETHLTSLQVMYIMGLLDFSFIDSALQELEKFSKKEVEVKESKLFTSTSMSKEIN